MPSLSTSLIQWDIFLKLSFLPRLMFLHQPCDNLLISTDVPISCTTFPSTQSLLPQTNSSVAAAKDIMLFIKPFISVLLSNISLSNSTHCVNGHRV